MPTRASVREREKRKRRRRRRERGERRGVEDSEGRVWRPLNNPRKARMTWSPASVIKLIKLRWMSSKPLKSSDEMKERDGATIRKERRARARKDLRHGNSRWLTRGFSVGINEKRKRQLHRAAKRTSRCRYAANVGRCKDTHFVAAGR